MDNLESARKLKDKFKFFNTMTDDEFRTFIGYCDTKQMKAGENLWEEGDKSHYTVFILSGKVGIKKQTEFKGKHMVIGTFDPGTVLGELCLLTDKPRSVTAVILEPLHSIVLSSDNFELLGTQHPRLALKLLKHIFAITVERLHRSTDRIARIF
jgi:CRP-like cAMP-binding protein